MHLGLIFRHYCFLGQCPVIAAMDWQSVREQKLNRGSWCAGERACISESLIAFVEHEKCEKIHPRERNRCTVLCALCFLWVCARGKKAHNSVANARPTGDCCCVCERRRDYCCDGRKHQASQSALQRALVCPRSAQIHWCTSQNQPHRTQHGTAFKPLSQTVFC